MAEFVLNAEVRSKTGKGESRRARSRGMLPAVIYGQGVEKPIHCMFKRRDIEVAFAKIPHRNSIMKIDFAGQAAPCEVIIRDYQKNPLNHLYEHVDFQAIDRKVPLRVEVDINLVGEPIGKKAGAILTTQMKTLRVECLPEKIPAKIDLDVSALDVGDSLHVSDVPKSELKIVSNPKLTICQMSVVKEEVVTPAPGTVSAEGAAAVSSAAPAEGAAASSGGAAAPAAGGAKPDAKAAASAAKKEGK